MAIPHKLRLFSCFVNGDNYLGKVTSFTRPKLSRKVEDYQGGGMLGAVGVDLGLEAGALDSTIVFGGVIKALFSNTEQKLTARGCALRVNISLMAKASLSRWSCAGDLLNSTVETQNREKTRRKATPLNPPTTNSPLMISPLSKSIC